MALTTSCYGAVVHQSCPCILALQVALLSAATSLPQSVNQAVRSGGPFYSAAPSPSSSPQSNQLNSGQIAGIVIGSVAGAFIVVALAAAAAIRYRRHRAGWRKDDLNDLHGASGQLDGAFGVTSVPTSNGANAPNAVAAEAGMSHNGAPLQYAHSPYSIRSHSMLEMQNSAGRNGHI